MQKKQEVRERRSERIDDVRNGQNNHHHVPLSHKDREVVSSGFNVTKIEILYYLSRLLP